MPQPRPNPNHKPSFFWQGLLILLPVAVLTVFGAMSLVQDEQTVEREARKRAEGNVQILAKAIAASVDQDLKGYFLVQDSCIGDSLMGGDLTIDSTNNHPADISLGGLRATSQHPRVEKDISQS